MTPFEAGYAAAAAAPDLPEELAAQVAALLTETQQAA